MIVPSGKPLIPLEFVESILSAAAAARKNLFPQEGRLTAPGLPPICSVPTRGPRKVEFNATQPTHLPTFANRRAYGGGSVDLASPGHARVHGHVRDQHAEQQRQRADRHVD